MLKSEFLFEKVKKGSKKIIFGFFIEKPFGPYAYYFIEKKADGYVLKSFYDQFCVRPDDFEEGYVKSPKKTKEEVASFLRDMADTIGPWEGTYTQEAILGETNWAAYVAMAKNEYIRRGTNVFPDDFIQLEKTIKNFFELEPTPKVKTEKVEVANAELVAVLEEDEEQGIENRYDYSTAIVDEASIMSLAGYLDANFKQMKMLFDADDRKNEQLRWEYKNHEYKNNFSELEFKITYKDFRSIECNSYEDLLEIIEMGKLNDIASFKINMNLNYFRGPSDSKIDLRNRFMITIKPYDIEFLRKSTHDESYMEKLEKNINSILIQLKTVDTIFAKKKEIDE